MKHLLLTTIAAMLVVGCGESQQSASAPEAKPEPPTVKAPYIDIHDAARTGDIEVVKQHLAAGTKVDTKGGGDYTPLHVAAYRGHKELAELLITKGADMNVRNTYGETPLDLAILDKHTELADLLRKNGGKTGKELKTERK
jgi:ankyrin repeat protein